MMILMKKSITLANDDFTAMAAVILEGLGGSANVKSIDNCITRLRLEINDDNKIDESEDQILRSSRNHSSRQKVTFRLSLDQKFSLLQMRWKNYVNKPLLLFIVFSENGPVICRLVLC